MNNSFEESLKRLRNLQNDNTNVNFNDIEDNAMMLSEHRNNDLLLTKKIEHVYNIEKINTTNKYITCQENLEIHSKNKLELEKYLKNLKNEFNQNIINLTEEYENEINIQIGTEELKLENLQRQIDEEQQRFYTKEKVLCNDLELLHASIATEIDELETNMYKETVDLNMRIRQMQNINKRLQEEINNIEQTEKKKEKFGSLNNDDYQGLIATRSEINDTNPKADLNKRKTIKRKETAEISNILSNHSMNTIVKNPNKTLMPKKKRKLFNPDDLTYLENLELKD
ncbi:uncharacterized protein LOC143190776 isoform X1 [Rhynchophorus ferrugineus]|uniref:uncharacterized protein LOC143190776 isoform X1 n=1 Tax=Rhynchophorus ferrugineus TaxID=354439 RepID=UPI003FCDF10D